MITKNDQELLLRLNGMVTRTNRYIQMVVENHCERWDLTTEQFNYLIHAYYRGYYNYWQSKQIKEVIDYVTKVQNRFRGMLRATLEHYDYNLVLQIGSHKGYDLPQLTFLKSFYLFRFRRMFHEKNTCNIFTTTRGEIYYNDKDNLLSTFFKDEYNFKQLIDEYEENLKCTVYSPCYKMETHIIPDFYETNKGDWEDGHIYICKISPEMYSFPEHIKEQLMCIMGEETIKKYNNRLVEVL